ncbi:hypothetical protein [Rhodopseudomonas palustris]|uniref:hypothetical protein n=1 Tax=Rhodopseudomonas palustris TaxID=1076 RepID=UPI000164A71F|nr:hypothetical protein [Rhodopseudomonas palustris]
MVWIAIDNSDPLPVEVVLVSHIDDDHIHGILDLTGEQRSPAPGIRPAVTSPWHNSFDDLLSTKPDELASGFGTASVLAGADINMFAGVALARQRRSLRLTPCSPTCRRAAPCATTLSISAGSPTTNSRVS